MSKRIRKRRPTHSHRRRRPRFHKRSAPGALPGTVIVDPHAPKPVIQMLQYGPDGLLEEKVDDVDRLGDQLGRHPYVWLNVNGLGDAAVIEGLGRLFHLHPLTLEDVVNVHQRPKVEDYGSELFVVARMITLNDQLETEQISMFLGKSFVITFQERPGDCFDMVRQRLRRGNSRLRTSGPDYLLYALLDAVVDAYFPVVEDYVDRIETLDEEVVRAGVLNVFPQIHAIRQDLMRLRKVAWRMRDAVNALIRDEGSLVSDDVRVYLRDCYDHTMQIVDVVDSYRELSADLREFSLTQIANRTNDIMRVLTIIATIFIPLSFIAGVYGMNFNAENSPWNMPELNWTYGYPLVLGVMGTVALGLVGFFWRRGWLRKD